MIIITTTKYDEKLNELSRIARSRLDPKVLKLKRIFEKLIIMIFFFTNIMVVGQAQFR